VFIARHNKITVHQKTCQNFKMWENQFSLILQNKTTRKSQNYRMV